MYTIGPVVRINPRELHIKDPHYYDTVYASSSKKQEKDPNFVVSFGVPSSMVATVGHNQHRFRRGLLSSFFSKRSVMELLPILHEKESELMQCFEKAHQEGNVLELGNLFAAFSADLISQYSWGVNSGFLDDENFNNSFQQAAGEIATNVHVHKFFPILLTISTAMPRCLLSRIKPHFASVLAMQDTVAQQSTATSQNIGKDTKPYSRKTIFDALSDSSVPPKERTRRRLQDEGLIVLLAGTETTARVMATAAFYIYQNKALLTKLRDELRPVMPTPTTEPSWTQLEQLPYLVRTYVRVVLLIPYYTGLYSFQIKIK